MNGNTPDPQLEHRLVEVETALAFQERLLSQLSEITQEFTRRLEGVEREVKQLQRQVAVLSGGPTEHGEG